MTDVSLETTTDTVVDTDVIVTATDVVVADSGVAQSPLAAWLFNMDTNDIVVATSLLLLSVVGLAAFSLWFFSPRPTYRNTDPLTYLMEQSGALQPRRRVKKKSSDGDDARRAQKQKEKQRQRKAAGAEQEFHPPRWAGSRERDVENANANASAAAAVLAEEPTEESQLLPASLQLLPQDEDEDGDFSDADAEAGRDDVDRFMPAAAGAGTRVLGEEGNSGRDRDQDSSSTHTNGTAYEENLKKSLVTLLLTGMTMTLHRGASKGPKSVFLSIGGEGNDTLRWRSNRMLARNSYSLELVEVRSLEWGKSTPGFLQSEKARDTPNDMCFSLVAENVTLDLQVSSKVERDLLVQGFTLLIGALKTSKKEVGEEAAERHV